MNVGWFLCTEDGVNVISHNIKHACNPLGHAKQTILWSATWKHHQHTHACFTLKITTTQERHKWRAVGTRPYLTFQAACLWQETHANERRWERHVWSALTSLEEKVNVWERPDRLGSTTSPEKSEAGLLGFESSSNDKLWNRHREQDLLSEHKDWGSFSSLNQKKINYQRV